jgi:mannonate dehydratase
VIANAKQYMEQGFRHVRVQVGVPGVVGYGAGASSAQMKALNDKPVFESAGYLRRALKLFEVCRHELGEEIELLHDVS